MQVNFIFCSTTVKCNKYEAFTYKNKRFISVFSHSQARRSVAFNFVYIQKTASKHLYNIFFLNNITLDSIIVAFDRQTDVRIPVVMRRRRIRTNLECKIENYGMKFNCFIRKYIFFNQPLFDRRQNPVQAKTARSIITPKVEYRTPPPQNLESAAESDPTNRGSLPKPEPSSIRMLRRTMRVLPVHHPS